MNTTAAKLHDPKSVGAMDRPRIRLGLVAVGVVLSIVSNFFGGDAPLGDQPVIGVMITAASVGVLITAAASFRMWEPGWWMRAVLIYLAAQTAGFWIIRLI